MLSSVSCVCFFFSLSFHCHFVLDVWVKERQRVRVSRAMHWIKISHQQTKPPKRSEWKPNSGNIEAKQTRKRKNCHRIKWHCCWMQYRTIALWWWYDVSPTLKTIARSHRHTLSHTQTQCYPLWKSFFLHFSICHVKANVEAVLKGDCLHSTLVCVAH